ncbi:MAG: hypothetical protein GX046_08385 [Tissierellia bacterium]|nr:hypothetical protein [Tissierellia bacterium]
MIRDRERKDTWRTFFDSFKLRGLSGIDLLLSDAYKGPIRAGNTIFI